MTQSNQKCLIIAEAGVNHNGDVGLALELVKAASEAGADVIKFQSFKTNLLVSKNAPTAEYQRKQTSINNQFDMLKELELTDDAIRQLFAQSTKSNIEFMSTPFDIQSAKHLVGLGMAQIKVPSGEITNLRLISELATFNKHMIVSTGMSTLDEIQNVSKLILEVRNRNEFNEPLKSKLTFLHCTSNYPASLDDINLNAMQTMREMVGVPVGYSDHSEGILVPVMAVAMGATIIEKHLTLDRNLPGPDHKASIEPKEFSEMAKQIREAECALGSPQKIMCESETKIRDIVRKSVTLKVDKDAGDCLLETDLILLRPGTGIEPVFLEQVVGKKLLKAMRSGSTLLWEDLCD